MSHLHAPVDRPAVLAARHRSPRSRSTVVATLACVAAGVGAGLAVKQQQVLAKDARVQRWLAVAAAPAVRPAPAVVAAAPTQVEAQHPAPHLAELRTPSAAELRSQLRWVTLQVGPRQVSTLDASSRLLLARSAAQKAGLADVGLDYRDVYGVIHAESSWVPRPGLGKNGVVSQGLAQFEPATARALGLRNPGDPVEAVQAAALHLKEAAHWSARRLEGVKLDAGQWAMKLREGISVYYNLSTRGRRSWDGLNSQQMPIETRLHIRNVMEGAQRAGQLSSGGEIGVPVDAVAIAMPVAHVVAQPAPHAGVRRGQVAWVRGKNSITLPEGSIRWSSREAGGARS
jgi:hypothetical protein